jgi:hypothetical protein
MLFKEVRLYITKTIGKQDDEILHNMRQAREREHAGPTAKSETG